MTPPILSSADKEMDEIVAQLNRDRDRMGRLLCPSPRMHVVIVDKHGKEIGTIPPTTFEGLDKWINTGHRDEA